MGDNSMWGVNTDGRLIMRRGISEDTPMGKDWATVDAEPMKHVSCTAKGHVWAIDTKDKIWYRKGASNASPNGTTWKTISGSLKQVSAGHCGVWGINADQCVYYRLNSYGDPDNEGTGWLKISDGKFQQIFSGPNCVLALAGNRDIYFRANVYQYDGVSLSPNQEGTHWVRIEQPKDDKIIFKQIESSHDTIWAVDKDNTVWFKEFSFVDEYLKRKVARLLSKSLRLPKLLSLQVITILPFMVTNLSFPCTSFPRKEPLTKSILVVGHSMPKKTFKAKSCIISEVRFSLG